MTNRINVILSLLFTLCWQVLSAQVYPVQVTTQLAPPYSLYLSDYVAPGSDRLVVTAYLNDIARPELNVRFKLRIEGQGGIKIETKPEYIPAPVSLQGGVPLRLISADLTPYFEPRNLTFEGITAREFEQRGKLPEGMYRFSFEVLEYNRGVKISNTGYATAWMILNDPPIINLPRQDERLIPLNPQNVVIQWTPRHTGSPNSAFSTEYEIEMVEVWPGTRNPNDAILTSPRILQTTTQSTTFIYGPAEVPLEPGRRYAFRIRAKSIVGVEELDLFKNNGYSEVFTFVYGQACGLPTNVTAEALNSTRFTVKWEGQQNHLNFKVRYRQAGTPNWYENKGVINEMTINSLRPSTMYEYQVMGGCGIFEGPYTNVATIRTKAAPEITYSCGLPLENFNLDPSKLTGSLKVGDVINAGDFDVELTKVTGGAGTFSGEGILVMPMMNKVKVKAEFTGITVAGVPMPTDYRMVKGVMNVTGGGVDVIPSGILNALDKLTEILDAIDTALTIIEPYIPKKGPDPISFAADTLIRIDGDVLAAVRNPSTGKVIVTTTTGKITELEPGKNYAITDKAGKGYLVDSNGGITKTTEENAIKASKRVYNLQLDFAKVQNTIHGFDEKKINALSYLYEKLDDNYYVPWKAVDADKPDLAKAILKDKTLDASKVNFVKEIVNANITPSGTEWNVNLTTIPSGETGTITAFYPPKDGNDKEQVLGKLNVIGYDHKDITVVIVPVNNAKHPFSQDKSKADTDLATELNAIYKQAVINWKASFAEPLTIDFGEPFDAGASDMLSNYTGDMKKVINAYGNLQEDTYYLFLIEKGSNITYEGYMPRSKQAGFLFVNPDISKQNFVHTAAHELGHGAFALKHTFSEFETVPKNTTKNLMDYAGADANELLKFQWDRVHDPVTVIGLFEEDEEGRSVLATTLNIKSSINKNGEYFAFLTPGGQRIILSKDQYPIFYHGIENDTYNNIIPGVLIGFRDKPLPGEAVNSGKQHWAEFNGASFTGYKDFVYAKPTVSNDDNSILLGLPCAKNDGNNFAIYKFTSQTLKDFDNLSTPILSVSSSEFENLNFFGPANNHIEADAVYLKGDNVIGDGQRDISNYELDVINGKYVDLMQFLGITTLFKGLTSTSHNEKPEIFLIIKTIEYYNRYPIFFKQFSSWFDQWNGLALIKLASLQSPGVSGDVLEKVFSVYSDKGTWENSNVTPETIVNNSSDYNKWKNNLFLHNTILYDFYRNFLTKLQINASSNAADNVICLKNLSGKTDTEIYNCIVRASEDEIARSGVISFSDRIYAIDKLLAKFWVDGESEKAIVKLIKYTPQDFNSDDLLLLLEEDCSVNLNTYIGYYGVPQLKFETTTCLWEVLFSKVNDSKFLFSGDNRKALMQTLLKHYYKSNKFKLQMTATESSINGFDLHAVESRRFEFTYDFQGIFRRLWSDLQPYPWASLSNTYVTLNTTVSNTDTGGEPSKIKVDQDVKRGFFLSETQYSQEFSPFDLTLFTNKSNLDLLRDFSTKGIDNKPIAIPMPAVMLHYASEVGDNQTKKELFQTGIDAATLFIPGGQLVQISKLGRALYYADKISSVASMGATAFQSEDSQISNMFNLASAATGVASLATISAGSRLNAITKADDLLDNDAVKIVKFSTDLADEVVRLKGTEKLYELTSKQAEGLYTILDKDKKVLSEMGHLNDGQKLKLEKAIEALEDIAKGGGKLVDKLDDLGFTALRQEVNLLDEATKAKFIDELAEASDDALRAMNENTSLLSHWKSNGNFIKSRAYPNVGHKAWDETKNAILAKADPTEIKILSAIENALPPSNSQVAVAGAYSPELGESVVIKYNDINFNVNLLEPELRQHLDYLAMIKNDFDKGGKLYEKLYTNVPISKIQNAGEVGKHAEVLATNEVIKQLKAVGKFNSIQDLNKIHVLVKGRPSFGNMCRCPHCFQILEGVKMIGNQ